MIFPSKNAEFIDPSLSHDPENTLKFLRNVDTFVFIDCTWNQTYGMMQDPRLQNLRCFMLNSYRTNYWRPQSKKKTSDIHLSTVEAVYHFCNEYSRFVVASDDQFSDNSEKAYCNGKSDLCDKENNEISSVVKKLKNFGLNDTKSKLICDSEGYTYDHKYDNLLFFYEYFRKIVETNKEKKRIYWEERRQLKDLT